jgi:hypothetical protein
MKRKTGNFFFARFKLILEMAGGLNWFWDGKTCEHGTTPGDIHLRSRTNFTAKFIRDNADDLQWTRVYTLPKSVGRAYARNM